METQETPLSLQSKRRATNLTVRGDLLREAKLLSVNVSRAAEQGIEAAVKRAKELAWLRANKAAIDAQNERVAQRGTLIIPPWLED